jgi:hypothetical protein
MQCGSIKVRLIVSLSQVFILELEVYMDNV